MMLAEKIRQIEFLQPKINFPAVRLTGKRIILRPPAPIDWEEWARLRSDSRNTLVPFEPAWHEESLSKKMFTARLSRQSREWAAGRSCSFLIFKGDDQTLLGGINMNNITRGAAQSCSLGYWLGERHQGQGYMGEAMRLVMIYGFDALKLHRINAATLPHNGKSMKLLRRHGFEEEGFAKSYLQINGTWQDHFLFGITEENFRKSFRITA